MTVLPPSFTRSFATPHSACAKVTYAMALDLLHASSQPYRSASPTTCMSKPPTSVARMPHRAPKTPAARFVPAPHSSYSANITATSMAVKPFVYACRSTSMRTAPSVTVNSRYAMLMMANGRNAFFGSASLAPSPTETSAESRVAAVPAAGVFVGAVMKLRETKRRRGDGSKTSFPDCASTRLPTYGRSRSRRPRHSDARCRVARLGRSTTCAAAPARVRARFLARR